MRPRYSAGAWHPKLPTVAEFLRSAAPAAGRGRGRRRQELRIENLRDLILRPFQMRLRIVIGRLGDRRRE